MMQHESEQLLLVLTTCPDQDTAQRLARLLVQQQLAACVQILPAMTSMYIWQEKLCQESEHLLVIKTVAANWNLVERQLRENHPYAVAEIVAVAASAVSAPYQQWLLRNLNISV